MRQYDAHEAAKLLGITATTVVKYIQAGKIKGTQIRLRKNAYMYLIDEPDMAKARGEIRATPNDYGNSPRRHGRVVRKNVNKETY